MIKSLLRIILLLIVVVLLIKYIPPINDLAKSNLPEWILDLLGEDPLNLLEKGLDQVESVIDKIKD